MRNIKSVNNFYVTKIHLISFVERLHAYYSYFELKNLNRTKVLQETYILI